MSFARRIERLERELAIQHPAAAFRNWLTTGNWPDLQRNRAWILQQVRGSAMVRLSDYGPDHRPPAMARLRLAAEAEHNAAARELLRQVLLADEQARANPWTETWAGDDLLTDWLTQ